MVFTKIRTIRKKLQQLQGKLKTCTNLVRKFRKYVIQLLDVVSKIKHFVTVQRSFGLEFDCRELKDKCPNVYEVRTFYWGTKCKHQIAVANFKKFTSGLSHKI